MRHHRSRGGFGAGHVLAGAHASRLISTGHQSRGMARDQMPMTGQNAVLDTAALERKAHVRATVVKREDAPAVVYDEDRAMATVHNEPPLRLQLLKGPRKGEFSVRCVHVPLGRLQAS